MWAWQSKAEADECELEGAGLIRLNDLRSLAYDTIKMMIKHYEAKIKKKKK